MNVTERRERLGAWIKDIGTEVSDLLLDRHVFNTVGEIIEGNPAVKQERSHFFQWMITSYVETAALSVRRQAEVSKDAVSIARVIAELIQFPELATYADHAALYPQKPHDLYFAERTYLPFGDSSGKQLDVSKLEADAAMLTSKCEVVRHYVDRRVAHYDSRGITMQVPTFRDLNASIDLIDELVKKYYLLILAVDTHLLPIIQYNWLHVFEMPWMVRPPRPNSSLHRA